MGYMGCNSLSLLELNLHESTQVFLGIDMNIMNDGCCLIDPGPKNPKDPDFFGL
jgi:hypothetical protein